MDLRDQFDALLTERDKLRERTNNILAAPRPKAEAEAEIESILTRARDSVTHLEFDTLLHGSADRLVSDLLRVPAPHEYQPTVPPFALLAAIAPKLTRDWLTEKVRTAYASSTPAMTFAQKNTAVAEVKREIAAVERRLTQVWWEAFNTNTILPDAEISPAIFLNAEEYLS